MITTGSALAIRRPTLPMPRSLHELYIVSDLHIGGQPGLDGELGSCMNNQVPLLARFVHGVARRAFAAPGRMELVINGDFLDFLAEEAPSGSPWSAFIADPTEALQIYGGIRDRHPEFFESLRELLRSGADLTLVLGNHDLETSLPQVRAQLLSDLRTTGTGRLSFVCDGEAHVVGDVLIEHGNRYDPWNVVDYEALRKHRSAVSRNAPADPDRVFEPPVGSRLVESVMNFIKRDWPFVDLLKPENEAVIPLLLALEPAFGRDLERVWRLSRLRLRAALNTSTVAGEPAWASQIGIADAQLADDPLREMLGSSLAKEDLARLKGLLADADSLAAPATAIGTEDALRSSWSLLQMNASGRDRERRMRILLAALRRLQGDRSFDTGHEADDLQRHVLALARRGFSVVVLGHTHLARELRLANGSTYLNTGTWANLMRLPAGLFDPDVAAARSALDGFVNDLCNRHHAPYLAFAPTYAHVVVDALGRARSAKLHRFDRGRLAA